MRYSRNGKALHTGTAVIGRHIELLRIFCKKIRPKKLFPISAADEDYRLIRQAPCQEDERRQADTAADKKRFSRFRRKSSLTQGTFYRKAVTGPQLRHILRSRADDAVNNCDFTGFSRNTGNAEGTA